MNLRVLLVVLLALLVAGTPGLGLETRTDGPVLLGYLYAIPFLGALGGLIASWRWARVSNWLAWIAGISAALLAVLDGAGLTDGQPPSAVLALDLAAIAVSFLIVKTTVPRFAKTPKPA